MPLNADALPSAPQAGASLLRVGSTVPVPIDTILDLLVQPPDVVEKNLVSKFIEVVTTRFDALTSEFINDIASLKERHSALITAAVTGQIDTTQA
ncbi:MAG: hypothetical protein ACWA6Y_00620 [Polaromonas sp.]